jgi:23S rRNA A2030 N6-methylase RlmJ
VIRILTVTVIVAAILIFAAISNAQPDYSNQYRQGSPSLSWEMYRQQQVELQIEIQRQQLEIRRQQLELQQQQLEIQRQQLEIQRQQRQMELEKQEIERQNK